jgi:chemotaxis protein CheX
MTMNKSNVSVQFINPFLAASFSVLSMILGDVPTKGSPSAQTDNATSQQVNVLVGVVGQAEGHVIFGMSLATADRIASVMIGSPVVSFDQLAASAIAELCNMICGNALLQISEAGFTCDLAPPSVVRGSKVEICSLSLPAIVLPLVLEQGEFTITVALQSKHVNQAVA